ncbi:MAG: NAD-dependent epimerase/dehydratase family protein [Parachlamydiales bacterium]|nr:NAD-dependent epimerase/dehydratase family protein [Parachlamydiales bacterium]
MNIANIGCGYVGLELAKQLIQKKHFVTATTKSVKSLKNISSIVQKSYILEGTDFDAIFQILNENDTIILTLSTNNAKDSEKTFLQTAQTIKSAALKLDKPKTLIFTSKSSIYGDHAGRWVDESADLSSKDEESKVLIDTENTLLSLKDLNWKVCILRLPHVYGPGRTIIDIFKSYYKNVIPGHGEYYTNMVHQIDVVNAIIYVLEHEIVGIFNVADDDHPTRKEFADLICQKLNLMKPTFDPTLADFADNNKRISNYRIKEKGFILTYPHRTF